MSRFLARISLPVMAFMFLGACQNYIVKPNVMPSAYAHHNQKYKTIPSPEAENLGYEYSDEKNKAVLDSFRQKVAEMVSQIEEHNDILRSLRVVHIYTPTDHDAQSAAFDHVLRDELRARDYTLSLDPGEGLILGYLIKEPDLTKKYVDFGDMNKDHRDTPHYKRLYEYEPMIVELSLFEGSELLDTMSAVYNLPMYGYERDYTFRDLTPIQKDSAE